MVQPTHNDAPNKYVHTGCDVKIRYVNFDIMSTVKHNFNKFVTVGSYFVRLFITI